MKRTIVIAVLLVLVGFECRATPQEPDRLIYKSKSYALLTPIASDYLARHKIDIAAYNKSVDENGNPVEVVASSMWRGYRAVYQIDEQGVLWLSAIELTQRPVDLSDLFENVTDKGVALDWYSGMAVVGITPSAKVGSYAFDDQYDLFAVLDFSDGVLISDNRLDKKQYRIFGLLSGQTTDTGTKVLEHLDPQTMAYIVSRKAADDYAARQTIEQHMQDTPDFHGHNMKNLSFDGSEGIDSFADWVDEWIRLPRNLSPLDVVEVSFVVDRSGRVGGLEVVTSSDRPLARRVLRTVGRSPRWFAAVDENGISTDSYVSLVFDRAAKLGTRCYVRNIK